MLPAPAAADLVLDLPRSHIAVGIGRRALRRMLTDCDAFELVRDAELAVSELLTLAVVHTSGDVRLSASLDRSSGVLHVGVSDDDPRPPVAVTLSHPSNLGAGLSVVGAVTTSWGVDTRSSGDGKTVWFEIHQYRPGSRRSA